MAMDSQIDSFASAAAEYCAWAEGQPSASSESEARTALRLLCALYGLALGLSSAAPSGDAPDISHDAWKHVYTRFGALPFNYYTHCFNPEESPATAAATADLADDLADIWRDLKGGLSLFHAGQEAAAAWEWWQSFWHHWGRHASGAIYALHCWQSERMEYAA
jgi:hypothetical protein